MKVSFYTLGCKVNQYETQSMREQFTSAGYEVAEEGERADICVINTCSVTNVADRKSRQYIRRMKNLNPKAVIAVTGCYAQTDPEAVAALEGVNIIAGTNEKGNIVGFVADYLEKRSETETPQAEEKETHVRQYEDLDEYEDLGIITAMESRSRAFVKIQEGCDRFCSYCIIPYARGKVRSRSVDSVEAEVRHLIENGYREVVLTGINTALYGRDLTGTENSEGLMQLLEVLSAIPGEFRIRLSSLEPNVVDWQTARRLSDFPKLCNHMHLSIQSGSDAVLKRMHRRYTIEEYKQIVKELRAIDPDYGITTDIIVGFPGETDEEFQETLETVKAVQFSKIHIFKYSQRNGTVAAVMPDQIDGNIKNRRAELLLQEAEQETRLFYQQNEGCIKKVLFERLTADEAYLEGYTDNYIKTYVPVEEAGTELLYQFAEVQLGEMFREGMLGSVIRN